jgi:hypothetical protein
MPDIFLDLRRVDDRSEQNLAVSAWRACAEALFLTPSGGTIPFSCIVDAWAPFIVLPYSLRHYRNLAWTPRGRRLTRQGGRVSDPLEWQGEDCSLGDTSVPLIDRQLKGSDSVSGFGLKDKRTRSPRKPFTGSDHVDSRSGPSARGG